MAYASYPVVFLQASLTALAVCTAAWAGLLLARRRWPALAQRRLPWLLAQLAGAVSLVLAMLPGLPRYSLLPADAPAAAAITAPAGGSVPLAGGGTGSDDLDDADRMPLLGWLWLACYGGGLAWHAGRWHRAHRAVRGVVLAGERCDVPTHPAFAAVHDAMPPVREVDAPIAPMLAGLRRPALLLPRHLRAFPAEQQQLIVAHELAHLRRRDHLWQHAGVLLQTLLWFIPAAHGLRAHLHWALELGCDRAVLAGRPAATRRSYAAALVAQLAVQVDARHAGTPLAALGFGWSATGAAALADRIRMIRDTGPAAPAPLAGAIALLLLAPLCAASVLLQPEPGWRDQAGMPAPPHAAVPPAVRWQAPLAQMQVTSDFGTTNRPSGKPHRGMDLRARRGTLVMAPADGVVTTSTDTYAGGQRYGKVVVIEHAGGLRTLYAHLDERTVRAGDQVRAGQQIGASGATGKVTGPHLHFEVQRGGAQVDPRDVLKTALPPMAATRH